MHKGYFSARCFDLADVLHDLGTDVNLQHRLGHDLARLTYAEIREHCNSFGGEKGEQEEERMAAGSELTFLRTTELRAEKGQQGQKRSI